MGKFFGTDGIRGVANQHPITPEFALKVGKAVAAIGKGGGKNGVLIGKDTRISGDMLVSGVAAGVCSMGSDALMAGVLPTPGVAYLTRRRKAAFGIVISASHNPYTDNGIKIFNADGCKISEQTEADIERLILNDTMLIDNRPFGEPGRSIRVNKGGVLYTAFLRKTLPADFLLKPLKVVIDCANGATSRIAPGLFAGMGAAVVVLSAEPDGRNINERCGSEHTETLTETVVATGADVGLAFDGDGDRLVAVDETGCRLTGDQILAIIAADMAAKGTVANRTVVSTVMSNMGFAAALKKLGLRHVAAGVGDRNVMEQMQAHGADLGGEESGHIILRRHHTTGDGILSGMQLLAVMVERGAPLSQLAQVMTVFPQVLLNVVVKEKPPLAEIEPLREVIRNVETKMAEKGRVLVRYSGTQSMCRVMIEGPDGDEINRAAADIAAIIRRELS